MSTKITVLCTCGNELDVVETTSSIDAFHLIVKPCENCLNNREIRMDDKKELEEIYKDFKRKLLEITEDVFHDLICNYLPYAETDKIDNVKERTADWLVAFFNGEADEHIGCPMLNEFDCEQARELVYKKHREELAELINKDLERKIKRLEFINKIDNHTSKENVKSSTLIELIDAAKKLCSAVSAFADNPNMSEELRNLLYINGIAQDCDVEPYVAMCDANDKLLNIIENIKL